MKRSSIIEARRAKVSPEVRRRVDLSFLIVDRIHNILEEKGLKQKDLANMLGKKESDSCNLKNRDIQSILNR